MTIDEARAALLDAGRRFGEAADPGTPDVDGMRARHLYGVRLKLAADALVRAERERGNETKGAG